MLIEPLDFADIVIAHAARVPAPLTVSLSITRHPEPTLAATLARTGARWLAVYDRAAQRRGSLVRHALRPPTGLADAHGRRFGRDLGRAAQR